MHPCQVIYKSVFVYEDSRDTVEYHEPGLFGTQGHINVVQFDADQRHIEISYDNHQVRLAHGTSVLNFDRERDILNDYHLDYGTVALTTRVVSLEGHKKTLKFVYELYQGKEKLSKVYLMIRIIEREQACVSS